MSSNYRGEQIPSHSQLLEFAEYVEGVFDYKRGFKINETILDPETGDYRGYRFLSFGDSPPYNFMRYGETDFPAIYSFLEDGVPVYISTTTGLVHRLRRHLFGNAHDASSLPFLIGREDMRRETGDRYSDIQNQFDFEKWCLPVQRRMRNDWSFDAVRCEGSYYRAFAKVFLASRFTTKWNAFAGSTPGEKLVP